MPFWFTDERHSQRKGQLAEKGGNSDQYTNIVFKRELSKGRNSRQCIMKTRNISWKKICFIKEHDAQTHPFQIQMPNRYSWSQLPHSVMSDFEGNFQDLTGCRTHFRSKMFSIRKYLFIANKEQGTARHSPSPHPLAPLSVGKEVEESGMRDWTWTLERGGSVVLNFLFITKKIYFNWQ